MTTMSNLCEDLVREILSRVSPRSMRSVRSTCKRWNALSKTQIFFAKAVAARHQFMGFMMMHSRVCYLKLNVQGVLKDDVAPSGSTKQINIPNQVDISQIFYCDGLLLCDTKDNSRLLVWNPYLGQIRWIQVQSEKRLYGSSMCALGYDNNNRNHKILRFFLHCSYLRCEIYDFNSNSWKVLDATPDMDSCSHQTGVSLKGNTYFFAQREIITWGEGEQIEIANFLICFDFTTESFGLRMPLPIYSGDGESVTLSRVREEQLAVLYNRWQISEIIEIWITTKIEPNAVSWSKFLKVDKTPLNGFPDHFWEYFDVGSFFIDEEKKVAVIFQIDENHPIKTCRYYRAYIIGEDGYFKSVEIIEAPDLEKPDKIEYNSNSFCLPLVCSSYVPSLVQLNQPGKQIN